MLQGCFCDSQVKFEMVDSVTKTKYKAACWELGGVPQGLTNYVCANVLLQSTAIMP